MLEPAQCRSIFDLFDVDRSGRMEYSGSFADRRANPLSGTMSSPAKPSTTTLGGAASYKPSATATTTQPAKPSAATAAAPAPATPVVKPTSTGGSAAAAALHLVAVVAKTISIVLRLFVY